VNGWQGCVFLDGWLHFKMPHPHQDVITNLLQCGAVLLTGLHFSQFSFLVCPQRELLRVTGMAFHRLLNFCVKIIKTCSFYCFLHRRHRCHYWCVCVFVGTAWKVSDCWQHGFALWTGNLLCMFACAVLTQKWCLYFATVCYGQCTCSWINNMTWLWIIIITVCFCVALCYMHVLCLLGAF